MPTTTRRRRKLLAADDLRLDNEEPDEDAESDEGGTCAAPPVDEANGERQGSQRRRPNEHGEGGFVGDVLLLTHYRGVRRLGPGRWQDLSTLKVYRELVDALALPDSFTRAGFGGPTMARSVRGA